MGFEQHPTGDNFPLSLQFINLFNGEVNDLMTPGERVATDFASWIYWELATAEEDLNDGEVSFYRTDPSLILPREMFLSIATDQEDTVGSVTYRAQLQYESLLPLKLTLEVDYDSMPALEPEDDESRVVTDYKLKINDMIIVSNSNTDNDHWLSAFSNTLTDLREKLPLKYVREQQY